jgi:Uma2 family endonuclease
VPAGERALDWRTERDMPLAIEIAGRGSRRYDVDTKAPAYLMLGVREAWVLDLGSQTLQVFRPGQAPATHEDAYDWHTGRDDVPIVHVAVRDLFADVTADEDSAGD